MSEQSKLLKITQESIFALDAGNVKLSAMIRSCIRIARLRNDFINLIWLQQEIIDNNNELEINRVFNEILPHLTREQWIYYNKLFLEMWIKERPFIEVDFTNVKIN